MNSKVVLPLLLCLALVQMAQAAPARYAGVSWPPPPGMKLSTAYEQFCPGRCVTYEGNGGVNDDWPLIRVHEPVVGTTQSALNRLMAAYKAGGALLKVIKSGEQQVGAVKVSLNVLELRDYPDDSHPNYALLLLLERGGVTLPLELASLNDDDLTGPRFKVLAALADAVKFDPEAVKKDINARDAQFAALTKAIAAGYARGERAVVYDATVAGVQNVYGLGGLTLQAFRNTTTAAFLPGGVFLDRPGEPDYRAPDLRRMGEGELPARWKALKNGYQVTDAQGNINVYLSGKTATGRSSLETKADNDTLWEIPRLSAADVAGVFTTISTSSSGGGLMPGSLAINSRSDRELELLPGGQYRSTGSSFTSVAGESLAGGVGNDSAETGRWSYDPASYTLTLKPQSGPARSGVTYTRTFTPAQRKEKNIDWTLLGSEAWWKSK
jgi:hypothetical protein